MVANTAAWIDAPYADLSVREAPMPTAGRGQVVVEVRALAVNALDAIIQSNGRVMYGWLSYPVVLGEDIAGVVVEVGADVSGFSVGDRVMSYAMGLEKGRDAVAGSGFQAFVAVDAGVTSLLPVAVAFEDAAVMPLAVTTAAAGLFEQKQLGLDYAGLGRAEPRDEIVVIWGGATSVGGNAIQLARAAGYRVMTTASAHNHDRMRSLGAEAVFDYHDRDVVEQVVTAVAGSAVAGILAIAVGSGMPSVRVARATGARRVAMASPPVSFYDQPRRAGFSFQRLSLFLKLGSRSALLQAHSLASRVRASFIWGSAIAASPVGAAIWRSYLPEALAAGTHQLYPDAHIVAGGLPAIQGALDTVRDGISSTKLVVTLAGEDQRP
ncbi:Zinc-type alcohol dehydrogenase-like protein [Microbacterium lemovicicum]|uniref:Zinc-type alcohol dehydrogenase-like protein n=2 Tax=Microbacterium lemovicicum TaxID=1072463 RepID=A0A3S9WC79_9MICO|nr:Zinc-type alcohol dehydrogenase-like protein [Microbacterium lemovicicum]